MVKYSRDQSTEAPRRRIWVRDVAAVLLLPVPDAGGEVFAGKVGALFAFRGELTLHHHLGGDAGVVGAGNPDAGLAQHAVPAREDVHLRLVEHVAHVQAAGDVGRRKQLDEGRGLGSCGGAGRGRGGGGGRHVKQLFIDPVLGPFGFNEGGVVGFGELCGHRA